MLVIRYFAIALTSFLVGRAYAGSSEAWPQRPIHVVVPFAAGSITDIVPRLVFEKVSTELQQPIVIENQPGAGSTIGAAAVAAAPRDGYTLLVNSSAHTIAPLIYNHLQYDPIRDFTEVIPLVTFTDVLVVSPSKGIRTLKDFVERARTARGAMTFASLGVGSAIYLNAERFRVSAGFNATQVPFKGAATAISEVLAGRVDYCFCAIGTTLPHISSGRLLALAVSSRKRAPLLPNVPTTLEAGFKDSDYTPWVGLFAPRGSPASIISKLHDAIEHALHSADLREKLATFNVDPLEMTSAEFGAYVRRDLKSNASLIAKLGPKSH